MKPEIIQVVRDQVTADQHAQLIALRALAREMYEILIPSDRPAFVERARELGVEIPQ